MYKARRRMSIQSSTKTYSFTKAYPHKKCINRDLHSDLSSSTHAHTHKHTVHENRHAACSHIHTAILTDTCHEENTQSAHRHESPAAQTQHATRLSCIRTHRRDEEKEGLKQVQQTATATRNTTTTTRTSNKNRKKQEQKHHHCTIIHQEEQHHEGTYRATPHRKGQ